MSKGFQQGNNAITGDTISKQYLDRYANFSKAAHFTLGGQDGSKTSQTKNFFSSKPVDRSGTKVLAENIRNMRGSHFSVGVSNEVHMTPAAYKVSMPDNAERAKPIDGTALRKESWILGQCPKTYDTSNQKAFRSPSIDP
mmetsp:Transcript_26186/g.32738  ORF Transcript_26186/g.32738 Transcript_26186/m.32738 type:complete len:140 (-) Transcript_26186:1510-1929(-)